MGNKFPVEIKESVEELKHRLHHAITSSTKERIQMLYLSGESFFGEFSHLDHFCFQQFLNLFSQAIGFRLNLIQMDNGSFHKSLDLKWPDHIIPIFQPPSSPELNPIERLWEHIKSQLSWEYCPSLDQLRAKLKQVLNSISSEAIASICGWDYIISALFSATS
ncbi:transposase [Pleurocapsa sp. CCALA 161]|uniref:transposase n=1 Tax=Pleurocapsa sp. CCALA 161 TaxID=2107688 RepID=UPI0018EA6919|nr:transposase [Pleurocapsa sp. CCALA 161]